MVIRITIPPPCSSTLGQVQSGEVQLDRRVLYPEVKRKCSTAKFSTAGNVMTKKRSRLTCDNMEELVYLHEVWPQVREWEAVKKMRLE